MTTKRKLTSAEAFAALQAAVAKFPTASAAAKHFGVSEPYLGDVLKGRRAVGPKLAKGLKLQSVTMYESI